MTTEDRIFACLKQDGGISFYQIKKITDSYICNRYHIRQKLDNILHMHIDLVKVKEISEDDEDYNARVGWLLYLAVRRYLDENSTALPAVSTVLHQEI